MKIMFFSLEPIHFRKKKKIFQVEMGIRLAMWLNRNWSWLSGLLISTCIFFQEFLNTDSVGSKSNIIKFNFYIANCLLFKILVHLEILFLQLRKTTENFPCVFKWTVNFNDFLLFSDHRGSTLALRVLYIVRNRSPALAVFSKMNRTSHININGNFYKNCKWL